MNCPCGTGSTLENCCGPYLSGADLPDTAEKLMRSRYTAYTQADVAYIEKTMAPEAKKDFDPEGTRKWATDSKWKGLKIVDTKNGGPSDMTGMVEFVATYEQAGQGIDHHEVSQFRKTRDGRWLFVDGEGHTHKEGEGHHDHQKPVTIVRDRSKIGRNDPCHCGSGKKFKKCCENAA